MAAREDGVHQHHLLAALVALAIVLAALAALPRLTPRLLAGHIHTFALPAYTQKNFGLAVQRAALRERDLVPIFGSSEIAWDNGNHARDFFRDRPTGFSVVTVAGFGTTLLETAQNVGALGPSLRGRKIAVSLSPEMFLWVGRDKTIDDRYAGNLSPLHVLSALTSPALSAPVKTRLATRTADFPEALTRVPVLALYARAAAGATLTDHIWTAATYPLAVIQRQFMAVQDDVLVLGHFAPDLRRPAAAPAAASTPDWDDLRRRADADERKRSSGNPWQVHDSWWGDEAREFAQGERATWTDERFASSIARSETWTDLELLCDLVRDQDGEVLFISMPYNGPFWEYRGTTRAARSHYYARLREIASRCGAKAKVFDALEDEPYFFTDLFSHFNSKGWVYFDEALDAFYHDALD